MGQLIDANKALLSVGVVGAGRTRGGLGPFLSQYLEAEGFVVTSVCGRSVERAAANAETIGQLLGHPVISFPSPAALCASGVSAVVIAAPAEHHVEALRAAAEAGLPTLCEKPLVHESHGKEGAELIEVYSRKRLPLLENCQWPYVLPAFFKLHGTVQPKREMSVDLGLGAPRPGRESIQNAISHLLALIQAVSGIDGHAVVNEVHFDDPLYERTRNVLGFVLHSQTSRVRGKLHLELCVNSPRPAWLAIDGQRMDRQIGEDYSMIFSVNGTRVASPDPVRLLVKHFSALVRDRNPVTESLGHDHIRQRLGWYRQILSQLP
jgi:hypothetical protein